MKQLQLQHFISNIKKMVLIQNLAYEAGSDQAQGTAFQRLGQSVGNDNDQCIVGNLRLFNPIFYNFC
jgi:hypothetical protein